MAEIRILIGDCFFLIVLCSRENIQQLCLQSEIKSEIKFGSTESMWRPSELSKSLMM